MVKIQSSASSNAVNHAYSTVILQYRHTCTACLALSQLLQAEISPCPCHSNKSKKHFVLELSKTLSSRSGVLAYCIFIHSLIHFVFKSLGASRPTDLETAIMFSSPAFNHEPVATIFSQCGHAVNSAGYRPLHTCQHLFAKVWY